MSILKIGDGVQRFADQCFSCVSEHVAEGGVCQRDWARFNVLLAVPHDRNTALVIDRSIIG